MPIQKGKRHKRTRRRSVKTDDEVVSESESETDSRPPRPKIMRRGRQASLRTNLLLGVVMLGVGLFFALNPAHGTDPTLRFVFLGAYLLVASFYLFRAYRQFRAGQGIQ